MCNVPTRAYQHLHHIDFLITNKIICNLCNSTIVKKVPDTNQFILNNDVYYKNKIINALRKDGTRRYKKEEEEEDEEE